MTCLSTVERWETTLGLAFDGCYVVSEGMLISFLSLSVEHLEMLCLEAVVALGPRARGLEGCRFAESLSSDVCLQEDQTWTE